MTPVEGDKNSAIALRKCAAGVTDTIRLFVHDNVGHVLLRPPVAAAPPE